MVTKKNKKIVNKGRIYIKTTFNNTVVTATDDSGKPFVVGSCGMCGFSGTRKSTPYAATVTVQSVLKKAIENYEMREVSVFVSGVGPGREASLRAIRALGMGVNKIIDMTPIPHNGVRPPKPRRG